MTPERQVEPLVRARPSNIIDSLYERAASFGRDVFHYIVTGTIFGVVCSVAWWPKLAECRAGDVAPIPENPRVQIALLFVTVIVLFGIGHLLLAIGFCLQRWWIAAFRCSRHVERYEAARQRVRGATGRKSGFRHLAVKSDGDVHMGLEMSVLHAQPRLHAIFIERYNTLWHLRLGMAAALLSAGIVALALCGLMHDEGLPIAAAVVVSCVGLGLASGGQLDARRHRLLGLATLSGVIVAVGTCAFLRCNWIVVIVGLVAIALGLLLMRQHLVTKTNFLVRILLAFEIERMESKGHNGT